MTGVPLTPDVGAGRRNEQPAVGRAAAPDRRGGQGVEAGERDEFVHSGLVQAQAQPAPMQRVQEMRDGLAAVREGRAPRDAHGADRHRIAPGAALEHQHPPARQGQAIRRDAAAEAAADDDDVRLLSGH